MGKEPFLWVVFGVLVVGLLSLDLGLFNKRAHAVKIKEALISSSGWILLAMIFNAFVYFDLGRDKALEFLTGYIVEESLSVDNLFVFVVIFSYFKISSVYHHKILFWGIVGAVVMRAIFIASGTLLLQRVHWIMYVFGAFLVFTGIKMLLFKGRDVDPGKNIFVKALKKLMPVSEEDEGWRFFVKKNGRTCATMCFVVLIVIETTDVMFAVDSIPAIFAITQDPFIVYTSNIFAVMGLRSLYFVLAGAMDKFIYLKVGLSFVLCFIGAKMLLANVYKIPISAALGVVALILAVSVTASFLKKRDF